MVPVLHQVRQRIHLFLDVYIRWTCVRNVSFYNLTKILSNDANIIFSGFLSNTLRKMKNSRIL